MNEIERILHEKSQILEGKLVELNDCDKLLYSLRTWRKLIPHRKYD